MPRIRTDPEIEPVNPGHEKGPGNSNSSGLPGKPRSAGGPGGDSYQVQATEPET